MDRYRVIVLREGSETDETLFEIAGPARRVMRLGPTAVLDTIDEDMQERDGAPAGAEGEPERPLADRVFDQATAAGAAAEAQSGTQGAETPKTRTRRTKAQIAADKEAQALGFRDAAHRAEAESQQQAHPGGPDPAATPATGAPSGYMTPDGPVSAPAGDTEGESQAMRNVEVPPGAGVGVAPPYNPFTQ
jgi:hypothetical protein